MKDLEKAAGPRRDDYVARSARQGAAARSLFEPDYAVANTTLLTVELLTDWIPVVGSTVSRTGDWAREKIQENARIAGIDAIQEALKKRPNLSTLDYDTKIEIVTLALKAAEGEAAFSAADAFQNEAIKSVVSMVSDIKSRLDAERAAQKIKSAKRVGIKNVVSASVESKKMEAGSNAARSLQAPSGDAKQGSSQLRLSAELQRAAAVSDVAADQLRSASRIAARLGDPRLAKVFQLQSQAAGATSHLMKVISGNPLSILPAVEGVLGLFAGGDAGKSEMAWIGEALKGISEQVQQLSEQVKRNHQETMERLAYLTFLGEHTREGISELLGRELDSCEPLIPDAWYQGAGMDRHLNLSLPLVFPTQDALRKQFNSTRWDICSRALATQFTSGKIGISTRLVFSREKVSPDKARKLGEAYNHAKRVYPKGDAAYLAVPARFVEDFKSPRFAEYAEEVRRLAGSNQWDPKREAQELLDPIVVERLAEYVLALHGLFDLVHEGALRNVGEKGTVSSARPLALDLLQSSLGHVTLSIAQQQMLYGVLEAIGKDTSDEDIRNYFQSIKFASEHFGLIAVSRGLPSATDREIYGALFAGGDLNWMMARLQAVNWRGEGESLTPKYQKAEVDGRNRLVAAFLSDSVRVNLPSPDELGKRTSLRHSEIVLRLARLQARLVLAINAFTRPESEGANRDYSDAILLMTAGEKVLAKAAPSAQ